MFLQLLLLLRLLLLVVTRCNQLLFTRHLEPWQLKRCESKWFDKQESMFVYMFVVVLAAAGKGPTMLLVKDKAGHVFGGYASEPWLKNGKYYGEVTTCPYQSRMQC